MVDINKSKGNPGYKIKLSEDSSFIIIDLKKPLPPETALIFTKESTEFAKKYSVNSFLIDVRGIENNWGIFETYQFAQDLKNHGRERLHKVAILTEPTDTTHSFLETALLNQGYNNRLFTNYDEAIAWVKA